MSHDSFELLLLDGWLYRGEGNDNLALSLVNKHQILRLPKTETNNSEDPEGIDNKKLDFYNLFMIPLLGSCYASPSSKMSTNETQVRQLNAKLLNHRPEHRRHKHLKHGWATLWNDYAFLPKELTYDPTSPVFAVEIKPKQGWCPSEERMYDKCQFCRNQYLKLQNGQIKEISSYCPMDLFSGNKYHMLKALKALISNPQNNFKMFCNGNLVYGENIGQEVFNKLVCEIFQTEYKDCLLEDFCDLMQQALLREFLQESCACDRFEVPSQDKRPEGSKCNFDPADLPQGCVLSRILQLQKLNAWGVKKYYDFAKTLIQNGLDDTEFGYLDEAIKITRANCTGCSISSLNQAFSDHRNLLPYLVAAILNDCSLMVAFQRIDRCEGLQEDFLINVAENTFVVKVQVFDLYPKPFTVFEKHMKRNLKVDKAYAAQSFKGNC